MTIYYTQSIDDSHQSSRKVVSNVQHGALLAGVDEAIAADRHGEQDHGRGGMVPSEGGPQESQSRAHSSDSVGNLPDDCRPHQFPLYDCVH